MNLPSFDDFLDSINPDQAQGIAEEVASQIKDLDLTDKASIYAHLANVGAKFSVKLLRKYHEWLSDYLKQAE